VTGGRVERAERHVARLRRDAERLGLAPPDALDVEALFIESAHSAFANGDGVLRIEWSRTEEGAPRLEATPRALGAEPSTWRAGICEATHPGPEQRFNSKYVDVSAYDIARKQVAESQLDEMLLFDAAGLLVEGGRSNLIIVTESGMPVTPDLALGPVEGLGLAIVRENRPEVAFARLTEAEVRAARELMAVNAVRGVVPITEFDGARIADGQPGAWAAKLSNLFRPV
jgi:branched-subunit amino acid aminotransferase/4-amino-4-deoxychorismate lyase